jgi:hypothetical protein
MQHLILIFNTNNSMKTIKLLPLLALLLFAFTSCSDDDDAPQLLQVESQQVSNLFAPQVGGQGPMSPISGDFTKFSFAIGTTTTSQTDWDIAFRGSKIIVNGGVSQNTADEPARNGTASGYVTLNTFAEVTTVDPELLVQDTADELAIPFGSDNGWYNYNFTLNLITPLAGRVLVFKTTDGRYVKVEILSYYENAPANPDPNVDAGRYYTFNYVYQPNEGVTTFN